MEDTIKLEMTREEWAAMNELLEQLVATVQKDNGQKARDWIEIDRLKAESAIVLADLERKLGKSDIE